MQMMIIEKQKQNSEIIQWKKIQQNLTRTTMYIMQHISFLVMNRLISTCRLLPWKD